MNDVEEVVWKVFVIDDEVFYEIVLWIVVEKECVEMVIEVVDEEGVDYVFIFGWKWLLIGKVLFGDFV